MTWSIPLFAAALAAVGLLAPVAADLMAAVKQLLKEVRTLTLSGFLVLYRQGVEVEVAALADLQGLVVAACEVCRACLLGLGGRGELALKLVALHLDRRHVLV